MNGTACTHAFSELRLEFQFQWRSDKHGACQMRCSRDLKACTRMRTPGVVVRKETDTLRSRGSCHWKIREEWALLGMTRMALPRNMPKSQIFDFDTFKS
jgi:hypothetical protein